MPNLPNTFPVLHTQRLSLIEMTEGHASDLFRLFSDKQVTEFYPVYPFAIEEDAVTVINMLAERYRRGEGIRWGIALKGRGDIIGIIGFNGFTRGHKAAIGFNGFTRGHKAAIVFALMPEYWGEGYITEAIKPVAEYGFSHLELQRIEAEVMPGNTASGRTLAKLGFKHEGLLRQWIQWDGQCFDADMYSLLKNDII